MSTTPTPEQRIAELESLLEKQSKELQELKKALQKSAEIDLSPYSGPGWFPDVTVHADVEHSNDPAGLTIARYARYEKKEYARWEARSEIALRKLRHLMYRLNPKGWQPSSLKAPFFVYQPCDVGPYSLIVALFHSAEARDIASKEMTTEDVEYLNWFNSPMARGE